MNDKEVIREIMQRHRGALDAIGLKELVEESRRVKEQGGEKGISARRVRRLITELIDDGEVIGTVPSKGGYFRVETEEELEMSISDLMSRVVQLRSRKSRLIENFLREHPEVTEYQCKMF